MIRGFYKDFTVAIRGNFMIAKNNCTGDFVSGQRLAVIDFIDGIYKSLMNPVT